MLQVNRLAFILSTILLICQCHPIEFGKSSLFHSDFRSFTKKADFNLSRTYDNVIAIALQCVSYGYQLGSETAFYADARFTFIQADGISSGLFRHVYTSQHFSTGTWKTDDIEGITLSSISVLSHWNEIHCDIANVTTSTKSVQRRVANFQQETVTLQCPVDYNVLTINRAYYGDNQKPNCTADVQDVIEKLCKSAADPITPCTFSATDEQLEIDPCHGIPKKVNVIYTCTKPSCGIGNNDIGGNCSTVSSESLTKKRSIIPKDKDPLIEVSPSNSNSTNYEKRIRE